MKIRVNSTQEAVAVIASGQARRISDFRYELKQPTAIEDVIYLLSVGAEVSIHATR